MSDPVIKVEGVGKRFRINHNAPHVAMRKAMIEPFMGMFRSVLPGKSRVGDHSDSDILWALRDIDFTVNRGEVLGIIGRNGAGKSTLLKVLSRVTPPTTGKITMTGRIAALLEVGTGFHPELTGRENIFLNGAVMAMRKSEIQTQFDSIVEFSGVERFLDTPVKRYSSGMRVRLGFAVAAHLQPEILIVDEVLAVGDSDFQARCIGKMSEVASSGRTVLVVSHNMASIRRLCSRAILISGGKIAAEGTVAQVVDAYLVPSNRDRPSEYRAAGDTRNETKILGVILVKEDGSGVDGQLTTDEPLLARVRVFLTEPDAATFVTLSIRNREGIVILFSDSRDELGAGFAAGEHTLSVTLPPQLLSPGEYFFTVGLNCPSHNKRDAVRDVVSVDITDINSVRGDNRAGFIGIPLRWTSGRPSAISK